MKTPRRSLPFRCVSIGILVLSLFASTFSSAPPAQASKLLADPYPGYPPITPRWAFEPWVWEDTTNTQTSTLNLVQGYQDHTIPVGAVMIDSPWETYYNTFKWDSARYPSPQSMIDSFHNRGIRVALWITGFVNKESPDYAYVKSQGYGVNNSKDITWWKGTGIHIDFTKGSAKSWWHSKMDPILAQGIDGWKVDRSCDYVSNPVTTSIGTIPRTDFKKYYYADLYDYSLTKRPEAATVARPYSSSQGGVGASVSKLPLGWSGDFTGDFSGINSQMKDVYESALRGYGAPGVEIGGYQDINPTKRSLIRYAQFGALAPFMENGGANGGEKEHLPWFWDTETTDIYRYFATLHSELVPYLFSYSVEANQTGKSIIRDPNKSSGWHKLGEELFVAVLTTDVTSRQVTFPSGSRWIDYWNDATVYDGGSTVTYNVPLNQYPVFMRAGAIIPMNVKNGVTRHGDSSSSGKTTLLIYPYGASSLNFHRPTGSGKAFSDATIKVDEGQGTISVSGSASTAYRLRVKSFASPASVSGADSWRYEADSQYVVIDKTGASFTITISNLKGYGGSTTPALITNLVVNDSANAADWSVRQNIQPGNLQYGDRSYTISSIGGGLAGSDWIRTANDSKAYTSGTVVTFKVTADADVYVAHRDEITTKPGWLSSANGWSDTGQDLTNSEPTRSSLFRKRFSANATVSLGVNGSTQYGMYTIIVKRANATAIAEPGPSSAFCLLSPDSVQPSEIAQIFNPVSSGELRWQFNLNWTGESMEENYRLWMQLGRNSQASGLLPAGNQAINLIWERNAGRDRIGYLSGGEFVELSQAATPATVGVLADLEARTFTLTLDGVQIASDLPFEMVAGELDIAKVVVETQEPGVVEGRCLDEFWIEPVETQDTLPIQVDLFLPVISKSTP